MKQFPLVLITYNKALKLNSTFLRFKTSTLALNFPLKCFFSTNLIPIYFISPLKVDFSFWPTWEAETARHFYRWCNLKFPVSTDLFVVFQLCDMLRKSISFYMIKLDAIPRLSHSLEFINEKVSNQFLFARIFSGKSTEKVFLSMQL